ncbi:MAG TPA: glutathione S-transferase family protein [Burkholderiales bacterium]|nr:glutathione S-transferase family protein [Burkholderiales bacterium]
MIKLCGFRISNYHNKVRIALLEKGIPHEENESVKPSQEDTHLEKSPMGKVPYLEVDGECLRESAVIMEYLEEAYPAKPLLPRDPLARAKVRELNTFIELHLELVVRPLYRHLGGKPVPDELRQRVEKDVAKGVRSLKAVAKFEPFIAGKELTIADCAAFVHLPLVTLVTKNFLGRDYLEDIPQVKPYLKMLGERPAFAQVNEDRKAASAAAKK